MTAQNIRLEGGRRCKAVPIKLRGTTYWLPPVDAKMVSNWSNEDSEQFNGTVNAFIQKKAVRIDADTTDHSSAMPARPEDLWTCRNHYIQSQLLLRLITENPGHGPDLIEYLEDHTIRAGPEYCTALLATLEQEPPF